MKTSQYPGFYEPESVNEAIQEAIDFINVEFFLAVEGWAVKLHTYKNIPGNTISLPVLASMAMIQEVRIQWGNLYLPMTYCDASRQEQYTDNSSLQQWGSEYRIMDNAFYFNPCLVGSGDDPNFGGNVQVEYQGYSKRLQSDTDYLETNFDHAMINFIKYRAASVLAARIEKFVVPWASIESSWYDKMRSIIVKRNSQTTQIREFGD